MVADRVGNASLADELRGLARRKRDRFSASGLARSDTLGRRAGGAGGGMMRGRKCGRSRWGMRVAWSAVAVKQHLGGAGKLAGRGGRASLSVLLDCAVRSRLVAMRSARRGAPTRGVVSAAAADSTMARRGGPGRGDAGRRRPARGLACRCLTYVVECSHPQRHTLSTPRWFGVRGVPRPAPAPVSTGVSPGGAVGCRAGPPALHVFVRVVRLCS